MLSYINSSCFIVFIHRIKILIHTQSSLRKKKKFSKKILSLRLCLTKIYCTVLQINIVLRGSQFNFYYSVYIYRMCVRLRIYNVFRTKLYSRYFGIHGSCLISVLLLLVVPRAGMSLTRIRSILFIIQNFRHFLADNQTLQSNLDLIAK